MHFQVKGAPLRACRLCNNCFHVVLRITRSIKNAVVEKRAAIASAAPCARHTLACEVVDDNRCGRNEQGGGNARGTKANPSIEKAHMWAD